MFDYQFPRYVSKSKLNYRDKERLFYFSKIVSDLYFNKFLKDLKTLKESYFKYFSLEYSQEYTGETFVIKDHPSLKDKTLYQIAVEFKSRVDYLNNLDQKISNYKFSRFNYLTRFDQLTDAVAVPDLYFLTFASSTSLSSTDVPIVDTSFFALQNCVSTFSTTTSYLNAKTTITFLDSTNVWYDHHKYYRTLEGGVSGTSIDLDPFNGAELFINGRAVDDLCTLTISPSINGSETIVVGSNTSYNNIHLIYSSDLSRWLLLGTSR